MTGRGEPLVPSSLRTPWSRAVSSPAWTGIDVAHLAIGLIEERPRGAFPAVAFETQGVPRDLAGARDLAERGEYPEFEGWALGLIAAQPGDLLRKGADRGLDGNLYFGKTGRAIVSVKAG